MATTYTEINADQALRVRIKTVFGNSLLLDFKFYDANKDPLIITGTSFMFTVSDEQLKRVKYQVTDSQWTKTASSVKKLVNPFPLAVGTYKIDFTATYSDGMIQTLMDGELVVRERYKAT